MLHNLLSIKDLTKEDILAIFQRADALQKDQRNSKEIDTTKIGGLLFFEPSTRTRIGFEAATWKLGVKSVVMQETKLTDSMSKAESMADTIRTLNAYVTFFCIRHPDESIFDEVVPYTNHPVINCGNGYQEHPTQALIDTYAIWKQFGKLDNLTITMVGELKYARAAHSLLLLLSNFTGLTINEVSPEELRVQDEYRNRFEVNDNTFNKVTDHQWGDEQVVYVTGFPPKNPGGTFSQAMRDDYKVTRTIADKLAQDAIILNALPRIDEIDPEVDELPGAYYFKQNELGLYVRMAVIDRYCL